jgi:uncharacterized protein
VSTLVDQHGRPIERPDPDELRMDQWANVQTGLGIHGLDKTRAGTYLPVWRILDQELTSLMNGSDIARKIVSKRPEEMFRRGFAIEAKNVNESENQALRDFCTDYLKLETNFLEGKRWGRLYGGALLIMGIDDGRMPWEPLDEDNIRSFDSLSLVDRRYSFVQSQYAAMGTTSKYGSAQIYLISNAVAGYGWDAYGAQKIESNTEDLIKQGAQVVLVHESRVIRFDGNPADIVTRQNLAGWSWSVLQVVYDAMRQFDESFNSAAYLLSDASQGVYKLQGLMKAISSGNRANFALRLQLLEQSRSVLRGIALDAGTKDGDPIEDFTRVPTPFGGIPDLLDKMMLRMSSAADMPATELFGRAPAGLNATGDNDTRKWYATIQSEQENDVSPQIKRVMKLAALAKKGPLRGRRVQWTVKWHPLWSPTDTETATTRLSNAQRDQIYLQNGVIKPEEVAIGLTDVYPNMDIEAREEALESGVIFDPYENQPAPTISANISGQHEGEPLSSKSPVPLMGTTGTQITKGALPAVAASMQAKGVAASHGAQSPATGGLSEPPKSTVKPSPGGSGAPNYAMEQAQKTAEGAAKNKEEAGAAKRKAPISKGEKGSAEEGRPQTGDSAEPSGNAYEKDASIVLVWQAPGELLTVNRPQSSEMAIPGGHVDPGETPMRAAIRELHEECGILVSELKSHGTIASPDGTRVHVFTAGRWEGVPKAAEPGTRMAWLSAPDLVNQASSLKGPLYELLERGVLKAPHAMGGAAPGRPAANAAQSISPDGQPQEHADEAAHLPAGSPEGGQFAPKEGAAGTAEKYFAGDKGRLKRLHDYTEFDYAKVNEFHRAPAEFAMRHGEKAADVQRAKGQALLADLRGAPKSPGVALRGVQLSKEALERFKPGADVTARGFWSSTTDAKQAEGFSKQTASGAVRKGSTDKPAVLHITHKSGVELGKASSRPEEKEVLIPHGTRFRIEKVERSGGVHHIHLTEA